MTYPPIIHQLMVKLKAHKKERKSFPDHVAAQSAVVSAEAGKLAVIALESKYGKSKGEGLTEDERLKLKDAALGVAAAALRFVENMERRGDEAV